MDTIAERLKLARGDLSQADLAKKSGVSPGTIGNIEAGTRTKPRELLSIARALNVSPEWLQHGNGPMRPDAKIGATYPNEGPLAPQVLDSMGMIMADIPAGMRAAFADVLRGWALDGMDRKEALLAIINASKRQPADSL